MNPTATTTNPTAAATVAANAIAIANNQSTLLHSFVEECRDERNELRIQNFALKGTVKRLRVEIQELREQREQSNDQLETYKQKANEFEALAKAREQEKQKLKQDLAVRIAELESQKPALMELVSSIDEGQPSVVHEEEEEEGVHKEETAKESSTMPPPSSSTSSSSGWGNLFLSMTNHWKCEVRFLVHLLSN